MPVNRRTPYAPPAIHNPGPYVAKVISHVDPRHSGDLRVELQTNKFSGNDKNEEGQIITARYLMPFYGVTDVASIQEMMIIDPHNKVMVFGQFHLIQVQKY